MQTIYYRRWLENDLAILRILNDNFSSGVISPILHYVLHLHEEVKLTNHSTNELEY